jgi:heat shock protein HslJ
MTCRTLLALTLVAGLACAGAATDTETETTDTVQPMEPIESREDAPMDAMDEVDEKLAQRPAGLDGAWNLTAMTGWGTGPDKALPEASAVTLVIDGEEISGRSGCNLYQSRLTVDGATASMERIGSTKRACPPPVMALESAFLNALGRVESWELDDDGWLTLGYPTANGRAGELVFERSGGS